MPGKCILIAKEYPISHYCILIIVTFKDNFYLVGAIILITAVLVVAIMIIDMYAAPQQEN